MITFYSELTPVSLENEEELDAINHEMDRLRLPRRTLVRQQCYFLGNLVISWVVAAAPAVTAAADLRLSFAVVQSVSVRETKSSATSKSVGVLE